MSQQEYESALNEAHRDVVAALESSQTRPLTRDEVIIVAWAAGVLNDVYTEPKHD